MILALPAAFINLTTNFVVDYSTPVGTILDSFEFFDPNPLALLNFTVISAVPVSNNFIVQQTGPNSGNFI